MANLVAIQRPTLLLDRSSALANIERMARKAARSQVRFRPHFKTHQSAAVGEWFRQVGVEAITVSSVEMARYFARHGWQDITIAFPVNILEIEAINQLARHVELGLLVESAETVGFLTQHLAARANIWLKVDTGYGRTGLAWSEFDAILHLAQQVEAAPGLPLRGLLTHAGHTYGARSQAEVEAIYRDTLAKLAAGRERLTAAGFEQVELSVGDTPGCSLVDDLSGVDEIRPGNFIFFDLMQLQIGACREAEIAVALTCPIVAKHPAQNKLVIYGGAVHLSKEAIRSADGRPLYGYVAELGPDGWGPRLEHACVTGLSQEHGLIEADDETVDRFNVGDLVAILPVHSCLTVNLMGQYRTLDGETLLCMERS
jgi:D-serine deaminase-like pyridoxal phosphate-dependent protein